MRQTYKKGAAVVLGAFGLLWLGAFPVVEPYCAHNFNPFDCDGPAPELVEIAEAIG